MKTHSYKLVTYRYVGKHHADDFDCGLCENKFDSLENLEIQPQTECRL